VIIVSRIGFVGRPSETPEAALQSVLRKMAHAGHRLISVSVSPCRQGDEVYEAYITSDFTGDV
jgi:hypothetical protein